MKAIDRLTVKYRDRIVGILSLTPDGKFCALMDSVFLLLSFRCGRVCSLPNLSPFMGTLESLKTVCQTVMDVISSIKRYCAKVSTILICLH